MRLSPFRVSLLVAGALALAGCTTGSAGMQGSKALTAGALVPAGRDLATAKAQFRRGNYGWAEKHFRKAVELEADNPEAWMGLAAAYDRLGRFDLADRAYEQLLRKAGRRPEIVNNMGYSFHLRGDGKKARELLNEAKAGMADPGVVEANLKLLEG